MPELPEVETIVRDLAPRLTNRTLRAPRLHQTDVLRGVTPRRFLDGVCNTRIEAVTRRAKHVVIRLANGLRVVIQPRMTGSLLIHGRRLTVAQRAYAVFEASIGRGERLVYRDVRRLGTIHLLDEAGWSAYTGRIGPEPLADDFDVDALHDRLRDTRQAVKKALMDQRRLAGVGNIYANEALYRARLDPSRPARRLSRAETARLHDAVRGVLREAVEARGTTVRDYRTGTGGPGSFQATLDVYGRGGLPCHRCGTLLTTTHAIDGRATTFCWRCQGAA